MALQCRPSEAGCCDGWRMDSISFDNGRPPAIILPSFYEQLSDLSLNCTWVHEQWKRLLVAAIPFRFIDENIDKRHLGPLRLMICRQERIPSPRV